MNQWWKTWVAIGLLLVVSACGSTVPKKVENGGVVPFAVVNKQLPSDGAALEQFGYAVAISGDLMVVGSPFADNDVNGDGTAELDVGSAYLLRRDGPGVWTMFKKLTVTEGEVSDLFGSAVAISGDTVVVGALYDNHDTNGDGRNEANVGAAYIFEKNAGGADNWGQVKKLVASDGSAGDRFGKAVAIDGDTVVVGAYLESHDVNKDGSDEENAGAAYIFERNQGGAEAWGEVKKLVAGDGAAEDNFGSAVAISGGTVVIGAQLESHDGNQDGKQEETAGAAYVFERDQGGTNAWGEVNKLTAGDSASGDHFGASVAVSGDTVLVGAYLKNFDNTDGLDTGAAYLFGRNQNGADAWGQTSKLVASDSDAGDRFGLSVAMSGGFLIVGAYLENHDTNGDGSEELNAGAAYIFEASQDGSWREVQKVTATDGAAGDNFAFSVAVSGHVVGVGVPLDDNAAGENAGMVYIYE